MQHVVDGPWAESLHVGWSLGQSILYVLPARVGMSSSMQSLIWTLTEPLFLVLPGTDEKMILDGDSSFYSHGT